MWQYQQKNNKLRKLVPFYHLSTVFLIVLYCPQVGTSLEDYVRKRKDSCGNKGVTWQPQVLALGRTIMDAEQFFVLFDNIIYEVDSLLKAVDICFKCFFVMGAEYPRMTSEPWLFIQRFVYQIESSHDRINARMQELLSYFCI